MGLYAPHLIEIIQPYVLHSDVLLPTTFELQSLINEASFVIAVPVSRVFIY